MITHNYYELGYFNHNPFLPNAAHQSMASQIGFPLFSGQVPYTFTMVKSSITIMPPGDTL